MAWRSGWACDFEGLRHLPPERTPTHFAIYPDWFTYLQSSGVLGEELYRAHLELNTIAGADDKAVFPAIWVDVKPAGVPLLPHPEVEGMTLQDSLDLAWLADEERHEWRSYGFVSGERASLLRRDVLRRHAYADRPAHTVTDGGREIPGWEQFRVGVRPGEDLVLVLRTDAPDPSRLEVSVDGVPAGIWTIARSETAWVEPSFRIPGRLIANPRPILEIRREDPRDGGSYASFNYWIYQ
jgi:hypothetical protein